MARWLPFLSGREIRPTDEQLMWRLASARDVEAFRILHDRWHGRIFRLCLRLTGDACGSEDLTQETFARVFRAAVHFHQGRRFSTWLWQLALNLCRDELRRRKRKPEVALTAGDSADDSHPAWEPPSDVPSPALNLEMNERHRAVRAALSELAEHYREVVVLRHYEGLKFAEIAEALDIPVGTVKSRMMEALKQLNTRLTALEAPPPVRTVRPPTSKAACL